MKLSKQRKLKAISVEARDKAQLPYINSTAFSNSFSKNSSGGHSTLGRISVQSEQKTKKNQPKVSGSNQLQQIMLEFVPDKFYVNSSSEVNFIANPVIPSFSVPSSFPSIGLN